MSRKLPWLEELSEEDDEPAPSEQSLSHLSIEAHEEFIQHIEMGSRKLRSLALTTLVVAVLLAAGYFDQIITPFITGQRFVEVDLLDPLLFVFEVLLLALTIAWMYVGAVNYLFYTRLGRSIKQIRALEEELEKRITG